MLVAKNYGKYAKIHYINTSSYIFDVALDKTYYLFGSCMIVSCFISLFASMYGEKKEIYSSNLLLHVTCSKKSYGTLLCRISSHMSCRKPGRVLSQSLS